MLAFAVGPVVDSCCRRNSHRAPIYSLYKSTPRKEVTSNSSGLFTGRVKPRASQTGSGRIRVIRPDPTRPDPTRPDPLDFKNFLTRPAGLVMTREELCGGGKQNRRPSFLYSPVDGGRLNNSTGVPTSLAPRQLETPIRSNHPGRKYEDRLDSSMKTKWSLY